MALWILEGQAKCRVKSGLHLKWDSLGSRGGKLQKIDRQVKKKEEDGSYLHGQKWRPGSREDGNSKETKKEKRKMLV